MTESHAAGARITEIERAYGWQPCEPRGELCQLSVVDASARKIDEWPGLRWLFAFRRARLVPSSELADCSDRIVSEGSGRPRAAAKRRDKRERQDECHRP